MAPVGSPRMLLIAWEVRAANPFIIIIIIIIRIIIIIIIVIFISLTFPNLYHHPYSFTQAKKIYPQMYLFLFVYSKVTSAYGTVCPRSNDPFDIESYYINWVTTSWTYSILYYQHAARSEPFLTEFLIIQPHSFLNIARKRFLGRRGFTYNLFF